MKMLILTIATLEKRRDEACLEQLDGIGRLETFIPITQSNIRLRECLGIKHCHQHQEEHDLNRHLAFSFTNGKVKEENDTFSHLQSMQNSINI
jgi:hypothetical protein